MTAGKIQARNTDGKILMHSASGKIMSECCCAKLPEIELTGTLDFYGVECDTDTDVLNASLSNIGDPDSVLTWARGLSLDAGLVGQLTALPASGTLDGGDSETIVVSLDKTGISAGSFSGTLTVSEQLLSGVTPASLPITVEIDTYASFPASMSQFIIQGGPSYSQIHYTALTKTQDATYCVLYSQVINRRRANGYWLLELNFASDPNKGPIEMWYNPSYGFESKYIYRYYRSTGQCCSVFIQESTTSPWVGVYPFTWNRGPEPATVMLS